IFLRNQNNQFMEAFITKPVKNSSHGKDAIKSYFQTEFKPNGLLAEDIAEFSGKICDEIGHNSIDLECGAKLNTGIDDIKLYLKGLLKAING
ncbi:hypothetical protein IKQ21_05570, partial [bacterium]|nr:hypothetical protein [bacterium]